MGEFLVFIFQLVIVGAVTIALVLALMAGLILVIKKMDS